MFARRPNAFSDRGYWADMMQAFPARLNTKEQIMKPVTTAGLVLLAALALSAAASTMAQAVEAPYYSIESKRLGTGETVEVTSHQLAQYQATFGTFVSTCTRVSVNAGATLIGSNAGTPGTSKEVLKFSECTLAGNGTCAIGHNGNEEVVSEPLKNELVYDAISKESKSLAVEFTPESGRVLTKVTLFGAGCAPIAAGISSVEGQLVAKALGGNSPTELFLLELGRAPVLARVAAIEFPTKRISSVVLIEAGVAKQVTTSLSLGGKIGSIAGSSEVALANGKKWCIIS